MVRSFLGPNCLGNKNVALVDEDRIQVKYEDLGSLITMFESRLNHRSLILVLADRNIATLSCYYALMACGHVILMLDPSLSLDDLLRYIAIYRPQYVLGHHSKLSAVNHKRHVLEFNDRAIVELDTPRFALNDSLALLLTTSGSTGNPKTVRLSYENLRANSKAFADTARITQDDVGIVSLPVYYTYGLAVCHVHFLVGAKLALTERKVYEPEFEQLILREKVTSIHGVPYIYECMERSGFLNRIPDSIRIATAGGGSFKAGLQERINNLADTSGFRFLAQYGQTEGTALLTKVPNAAKYNDVGCVGLPCQGMEASVDPINSELCFSGPSVSLGYANGYSDLSKGDDNQGFLRTGDTDRIEKDGRIYLTGRLTRIIKIKGIRYNLDDIERLIALQFNTECICIEHLDKLFCGVIACEDDSAVANWTSRRFKISLNRISVVSLDDVPKQGSGKIDYGKFKEVVSEGCNLC